MAIDQKHLTFDDISYHVQQQTIFKQLNLRVQEHDVLVVLGASGVGKSTLLNLALGFTSVQQGSVKNTFGRTSCVYQEPRLFPWLKAIQNIELALKNDGLSHKLQKQRATEMGLAMGLNADDLRKYPSQLSGGMAKRVSFARGLVCQPDLLLLDEPFNGVDMAIKESLYKLLIQAVLQKGLSLVLVTHDLLEAVALANKIIVMDREEGLSQPLFIQEPYEQRDLAWRFEKAAYLLKQAPFQRFLSMYGKVDY